MFRAAKKKPAHGGLMFCGGLFQPYLITLLAYGAALPALVTVFCFRFLDSLPLHVTWRIRAACAQGLYMINDISGASAARIACAGAWTDALKFCFRLGAALYSCICRPGCQQSQCRKYCDQGAGHWPVRNHFASSLSGKKPSPRFTNSASRPAVRVLKPHGSAANPA